MKRGLDNVCYGALARAGRLPSTTFRTQFGLWRFPGPMTNVKNRDYAFCFADAVIDEVRAVHYFTDGGPLSNHTAHAGESS